MDPLAHTLVGATLAEMGLSRSTRLATATLIIGANLPDVDALSRFFGENAERSFRRGWTHGVLAMVVLPLLLTGAMLLYDRLRSKDRERARPRALLGLSCISIWSHPLLDWLNTYGIRLLMPFDGTWFYGDALFIIDPFLWLTMGAVVILAHSRTPLGIAGWIALGAATTALLMLSDRPPLATKIAWCVAVVVLLVLRVRRWSPPFARAAQIAFSIGLLYIGAMIAASEAAEGEAKAWLRSRGVAAEGSMAAPSPGNPFHRTVVVEAPEEYRVVEIDWLASESPKEVGPAIPRGKHDEIVEAARRAPGIGGFVDRLRFPVYRVEELPGGWLVHLKDARRIGRSRAFSGRVVRLNAKLEPVEVLPEEDG